MRPLLTSLLWSSLVVGAALAPVAAQGAADPLVVADPAAVHVDRLCVKLQEGTGAELVDGRLRSRTGADLEAVARWFRQARVEPLVATVSWDELDRWHDQAAAVLPEGRRPGHLGLWFRVHAASAAQAEALHRSLAAEPLVTCVYHEPRYFLASAAVPGNDPLPPTPAYMALQGSHGPTTATLPGHDFPAAAAVYGGRGRGIGLRVIEDVWIFGHEDVEQLTAANLLGPAPAYEVTTANHGLSGASLVVADRNAFGITGAADEASARLIAIGTNGGIEGSLALAVSSSQPGDVVMIVIMVLVPGLGPGTFVPLEFYQAGFDAVRTATALNRHVVIPAGNGNRSLDDPALLGRFDRSFRDSGAIIVAASAGGNLQKAQFSNWGSRIDAHSWGDGVISCGYGTLFQGTTDFSQAYTAAATGTSSSTPHLAGAIAAIQGAARMQLGQTLSNAQIAALLAAHGATTPDVIGRRTDLPGIFTALGIYDGLRLSAPDAMIGAPVPEVLTATLSGAENDLMVLFGGLSPGNTNLGFNRPVHIDLGGLLSLGAFVLPSAPSTASWQLVVPNDLTLRGTDLYFQAVRWRAGALHVTNSCHATLL
ncbi:MAG: S8 family serine peptidase [Planctomycetes bacterium]|jgi:hypothetical protein|nr:S8 family serine peptidase [Planctomycetota bacterium]